MKTLTEVMSLATFVEELVERNSGEIAELRKVTALNAVAATRYTSYRIRGLQQEDLIQAYDQVIVDLIATLRFYVRELQKPDELEHREKRKRMGYRYRPVVRRKPLSQKTGM